MDGGSGQEKRYSDEEVQEIMARLTELQIKTTLAESGSGAGTTFQQLQQAAAEMGLNTDLLKQAVTDVSSPLDSPSGSFLWGGPWKFEYDRVVTGRVTSENWPALVEDLRAQTRRIGTPKDSGMLFEWLSNQPDPLHVSISPGGGDTRVRVVARFGDLPGFLHSISILLIIFGGIIAVASGLEFWMACLLWIGLGLVVYSATRAGLVPYARKRNREMRELVALLEHTIAENRGLSRTVREVPLTEHLEQQNLLG